MVRTIPFFSGIGQSFKALFTSDDEEVKKKNVENLKARVYELNGLKALSQSPGWMKLAARCDERQQQLVLALMTAKPDEVSVLQKQIQVLREVIDISSEMSELERIGQEMQDEQ